MICVGYVMIHFMKHSPQYMFHDTFVILSWKAESYNPGLWSGAPHSKCFCCLCSNHVQWIQQWQPHQSFQVQLFYAEFLCFIGIHWLLSVSNCSFVTIASNRTVWHCIVISLWEREREIKFIGLFEDRGHRGSYSPYKPFNHNLYIGIIIFPHIDNPQSTGYN